MNPQPLTLEQLQTLKGKPLGTSAWHELDQQRINAFADATEDWQFIHVDPDRALTETPFGGTIAHGQLTLSLLPAMTAEAVPPLADQTLFINYGFDKVRFLSPVPSGARVRGHFTLADVTPKPGNRVLLRYTIEVEIEHHDKPALVAEWLGLSVRE